MTFPARVPLIRVAKISGGLALGGAVMGAVCAPVAAVLWYVVLGGDGDPRSVSAINPLAAAMTGATLGLVITPLLFWGLLRHVSFGRVLVVSVPATIVGALVGDRLKPSVLHEWWIDGLVLGAVIGFGVAAIVLRIATGSKPAVAADDVA